MHYFNDTIDRLSFIKQKVLPATVNKETSIATLLNDVHLPCSYVSRFSAQNTSDSCRPSRIVFSGKLSIFYFIFGASGINRYHVSIKQR